MGGLSTQTQPVQDDQLDAQAPLSVHWAPLTLAVQTGWGGGEGIQAQVGL